MAYYIGVDIGGTNIACGIVDEEYNITARSKVKTNTHSKDEAPPSYDEILDEIKEVIRLACKEQGISPSDAK